MLGKKIPDFSVPATGEATFRLSDHKGHPVVLYFYPKDNTPGCTTEGARFRDLHKQFAKLGAVVAGVSRDSIKSHEGFKAKMAFPVPAALGCRREALRAVRRHQDEEHVRKESPRHRALDVPRSGPTASSSANGAR